MSCKPLFQYMFGLHKSSFIHYSFASNCILWQDRPKSLMMWVSIQLGALQKFSSTQKNVLVLQCLDGSFLAILPCWNGLASENVCTILVWTDIVEFWLKTAHQVFLFHLNQIRKCITYHLMWWGFMHFKPLIIILHWFQGKVKGKKVYEGNQYQYSPLKFLQFVNDSLP
jgi:hypothetical protein